MDAIRLSPEDNVATLLRAVAKGETVRVGATLEVEAGEAIALCHKIALVALKPGDRIVKYGDPIGEATQAIPAGAHVHVHNLRSLRARSR